MEKPPPPFTMDQLNAMKTDEERARARAALTSYIVRMKKEYPTNEYSTYGSDYKAPGPHRGGSSYSRGGHATYHPYQRPGPFKHKSMTFSKPDDSGDKSALAKEVAVPFFDTHWKDKAQQMETKALCSRFTITGSCSRRGCPHMHDPKKLAICKGWLFKGDCAYGAHCSLSHDPSPHNVPTCLHFQDSRCKNEGCRFAHIRINPSAPNCEAFGLIGYCEKGIECAELHAHECPRYSNTGVCRFGDMCRLVHVQRASRMRKAIRPTSEDRPLPSNEVRDLADSTSTPRNESSETNSPDPRTPHDFTQQTDFVSLCSDD